MRPQAWSSTSLVTPTLLQLHWLSIEYRVRCKLCLLVHQAISGRTPLCLANLLMTVASVSSRASLRSAGRGDLPIPANKLKLGNQAFSVSGPATFNDLQQTKSLLPIQLFLNVNLKHFYSAKPMMLHTLYKKPSVLFILCSIYMHVFTPPSVVDL
jgi:hypothetical protein